MIKLKATICRHINEKLSTIIKKSNIKEFARNINKIDEIRNLISGSLSEPDLNEFVLLMQIKTYYCGD